MRSTVLVLATILVAVSATNYNGYKIYRIQPQSLKDVEALIAFPHVKSLEFLSPPNKVGKPINILVSPSIEKQLTKYLENQKITFGVEVSDVEEILQKQQKFREAQPKLNSRAVAFDRYLRHSEINDYLAELQQNYPDLVRLETIGQSYEGRDLTLIHISNGNTEGKPTIFIDAGIHAREWIAPAVSLYIINQLVENSNNQNLIEDVNWTILPSVNPDGYEFCFTDDRFWRKTRSEGQTCYGADPNRNFDFHWMDVGADDYECSDIYAGPEPFSEVEAQALRDYLLQAENVRLYLTLHSCGQYLLYPWGWTSDLPDNWEELDALAQDVNDAISAVRGTEYTIGSSTNVLYAASGASDDWSYGVAGIKLVYTVELPCGGSGGFDLPEVEIQGVVEETWEGIKVYHDYVANLA